MIAAPRDGQRVVGHHALETAARVASALSGCVAELTRAFPHTFLELAGSLPHVRHRVAQGLPHRVGTVCDAPAEAGTPCRLAALGTGVREPGHPVARHCTAVALTQGEEPDRAQSHGGDGQRVHG